jgi:hypothetical protein
MDVLLDTNAVRASGLDGAAFSSLREYLSRTKSRLLLPDVVVEELCAQRRAEIDESVRKIASGNKALKRLVPDFSGKPPKVNVEAAVASYRSQLEQSAEKVTIIENSSSDLKELVHRLANRIPPASSKGEEARDVLLWLSVLTVGQKQETAFVSGDKRAFFQEGSLKSELDDDLKASRSKITAYEGLDNFLKAHHRRSSWVDEKWVVDQVGTQQVDDALEAFLKGREERFVRPYIDNRASPTGYASLNQVVQREVRDFFVSDMTAGALLVGVTLWAELELEIEYESYVHDWLDWRDTPTVNMKIVYPTILAELELEVVGRKVKSVSVSDVERD